MQRPLPGDWRYHTQTYLVFVMTLAEHLTLLNMYKCKNLSPEDWSGASDPHLSAICVNISETCDTIEHVEMQKPFSLEIRGIRSTLI